MRGLRQTSGANRNKTIQEPKRYCRRRRDELAVSHPLMSVCTTLYDATSCDEDDMQGRKNTQRPVIHHGKRTVKQNVHVQFLDTAVS